MQTVTELDALRRVIAQWRRLGERIAFVPTMGNLHAGHYSLIELARRHAPHVVASVFVNPTQFGPNEDFGRYPRTPERDAEGLGKAGCDLLWLPSVTSMYPSGAGAAVTVVVPGVTGVLEGEHRPGHFDGVASVVARLFNQVQPDVAVFGRKDYQQLAVIRYMVRDLAYPIDIVAAPTLRESDGLAMSSRNQYLSEAERPVAATIHRVLQQMARAVQAGRPLMEVEADAGRALRAAGFVPDYAVIRAATLEMPAPGAGAHVALIAARLGCTRLIDNLEFDVA